MTDWYQELTAENATPGLGPGGVNRGIDWYGELTAQNKPTLGVPEVVSDTSKAASPVDVGIASIANDPQAQIRWYAKQRGIPEDRYDIINGNIVYRGEDDKYYREDPGAVRQFMKGVGPSFPAVPAAAVGILTAPANLSGPAGTAVNVGATAAAAGAGQAVREQLASSLMGQEKSIARVGEEAVLAGTGELFGAGLTAFAQRKLAKDIARLDPASVAALKKEAQSVDIPLTPAELTNLPSLKAQQKALGNLPQSADTIADFYRARAANIERAVSKTLHEVSPTDSPEIAGRAARKAAEGAIDAAKATRARAASPLYEKALSSGTQVDTAPILGNISRELETAKGPIETALKRAGALLLRTEGEKVVPDTRLEALHQAKLALDDMISTAKQSGLGNTAKRKLVDLQKQLLKAMDDASPEYRAARHEFRSASPAVTDLENGLIGVLKDLPDTRVAQATRKLFSPASSGPVAVREAKDALQAQSPEAWQAVKRAYLEELWQKAGQEYATTGSQIVNRGAKFRAALLGDMKQRAILKAALEPKEWQALNSLADVLEASGRVKPVGSDTAWNQEMMRMARDEARPVFSKIVKNLNPAQLLNSLAEWRTEAALGKKAGEIADIITQPDAMQQLRALKRMSPASARYRVALAHLLYLPGRAGVEGGLEATGLSGPSDTLPNQQ